MMVPVWWYILKSLVIMRRLLLKHGAESVRIFREKPGRYRLDIEGDGEKQQMWGIWVPWERRLIWHHTPSDLVSE